MREKGGRRDVERESIIHLFQSVFSAKGTTPLRISYLHCIRALCGTKALTASILPQFLSTLTGSVEKAATKSAQLLALEEGLVAVHILLELQGPGERRGWVDVRCATGVCVCVL